MARTAITITEQLRNKATQPTATAGDDVNDHDLEAGSNLLVIGVNTNAAQKTATIKGVAGPDGITTTDVTMTMAATDGVAAAGPFDPARFIQSDGKIYIDSTSLTNCKFYALRLR